MRQVMYLSYRAVPLDRSEMDRIWIQSQHNNALTGVTGVLWSDGDTFAQILEGGDEAVADTLKRIRRDKRHSSLQIVSDRSISQREFGSWSMIRPYADEVNRDLRQRAIRRLRPNKSEGAEAFMEFIEQAAS